MKGTKMKNQTTHEDFFIAKNDRLDNIAYDLACNLASPNLESVKLEWDMSVICDILDAAEEILKRHSIQCCYPYYAENEVPCPLSGECTHPDCILKKEGNA